VSGADRGGETTIVGEVLLEPAADLDRAQVVVTLRDTSLADMPAMRVAEAHFRFSGRAVAAIPFRLRVERRVDPRRRHTLAAEIRRHGGADLLPGDLLTVQSIPWTAADGDRPVRLPVRAIA
jgi:uncharacterized lipoprotein YbaY